METSAAYSMKCLQQPTRAARHSHRLSHAVTLLQFEGKAAENAVGHPLQQASKATNSLEQCVRLRQDLAEQLALTVWPATS